ncbi:MAG: apolipoprotein N-acyltransferase [Bacteroidetes bacterium]|nr:apolipoprotein N-acyltransferase [Bacteroidota bacterium]
MFKDITQSKINKNLLTLSLGTAILLGISFPPFPTGFFAMVGFVPFLLLIDKIDFYGKFFRYSYFTFFIFCVITLYWTGGFTHHKDPYLMLAGGALLLFLPLVFTVFASFIFFVRKKIKKNYSLFFLPFLWVTCEWLLAYGEFSFPWLTLGNSQTYQVTKIQIADITGVYGLSFWILFINAVVYIFVTTFSFKEIRQNIKKAIYSLGIIFLLYFIPDIYGIPKIYNGFSDKKEFSIGVIQPNLDPWDKWEGADSFVGRWNQVKKYLNVINNHLKDSLDIVVLPETAILLNLPELHDQYNEYKTFIDTNKISILTGYVKVKYYREGNIPVSASKISGTDIFYDSYNSIMFTQPSTYNSQIYSKMRLVPLAERIPYAETAPFLIEPLRWGVGVSNWGKGTDSTVFFDNKTNSKFLAMICYESIYPEFVSSFVKKGAEFLVFITNDSWWGNTSGAQQHKQYAVLRAVENRRWVIRCANGGVSCFIDPLGNIFEETKMYSENYISKKISLQTEQTYYTKHGDLFARICAWFSLLILLFTVGYTIYKK